MTRAAALILLATGVAWVAATARPTAANPPAVVAAPALVAEKYAVGYDQYQAGQVQHNKRSVELAEAILAEQRRTNDLLAQLVVAGGKAAAVKAPPKPDVLAVAARHCARCHSPGKADEKGGGYVLFADDTAKAFKPVSAKDREAENNLIRREVVTSHNMPKGGRLGPAERSLFESPVFK